LIFFFFFNEIWVFPFRTLQAEEEATRLSSQGLKVVPLGEHILSLSSYSLFALDLVAIRKSQLSHGEDDNVK
jgi:hypothetical protein